MRLFKSLLVSISLLFVLSCQQIVENDQVNPPSAPKKPFKIISGSENKGLEALVKEFASRQNVSLDITYKGSVDIMLELQKGSQIEYDAVWPANSLWIELGDKQKIVKHDKSIMRSPVCIGVKKSVAEKLGWIGKDVKIIDILEAAEKGSLRFTMTSATQSNSGASAYLGFLHAMAESPDVLTKAHLEDEKIQSQVKRLLKTINRSSGSSGWLRDMMLQKYNRYDAMINYEAMIIEANLQLVRENKEPLIAIYPQDGMLVADSPLGFINKGDKAREDFFLKLQEYLSSADTRAKIEQLGRRAGIVGLSVANPNPAIFNPDWGIDPERIISPVPLPQAEVISLALELYQTILRKPSFTVYVLDYSGSMQGDGIQQLRDAMFTLMDTQTARRYMLQPSKDDIHVVIPFNSNPIASWQAKGNDELELRQLYQSIERQQVGGGTNIYKATTLALKILDENKEQLADYFPAIILMSDGKSSGELQDLIWQLDRYPISRDIPLFSITFGKADPTQMEEISQKMSGRVFDGRENLVDTFRKAKGYN